MLRWLTHPLMIMSCILLAFLIYLSMPQQQGGANRKGGGAVPVKAIDVNPKSFRDVIEALGTARANESVTLTSTVTDIVEAVRFDDGQQVNKGELLVSLQNREEKARISELQAKLDEAKRQLKRIKNLQREAATSEQLLDEQLGEVKTLQAQLEVANTRLDEMHIYAPFSGVLGIRKVSPGALLKSGEAITTLDDLSKVKVDFSVAEVFLPELALGQKVTAKSVAYPNEDFNGVIAALDSRIDPVTRSVQVRAHIDNQQGKLRAGMLFTIELEKRVDQIILLPEGALVPINDQQFVYRIKGDGTVERVQVEIGRRRVGEVEIVSGINSGDKVVTEGTLRLTPNAKVNVLGS